MRYLILGGNGLVGKYLCKTLRERGDTVLATSRNAMPQDYFMQADILNNSDLEKAFEAAKPEVVINATNLAGGVDFCENNPDKTTAFHFEANKNIGVLCLKYNAKMVLISTDYVFDGTKPPYTETDEANPLNAYGREKLKAEQWMQENLKDYLIARTTNVYGWDPETKTPNFLMSLYFKLSVGERINAPSFLWGNPTHVSQLGNMIIELCDKKITGLYNVVGSSFIDRWDWSNLFCEKLGLDASLLNKIDTPPTNIAPRPWRSHLTIDKVKGVCSSPAIDVHEGLNIFLSEMTLSPKA